SNLVNAQQIRQTSSRPPHPRFDIQIISGIFPTKAIIAESGKLSAVPLSFFHLRVFFYHGKWSIIQRRAAIGTRATHPPNNLPLPKKKSDLKIMTRRFAFSPYLWHIILPGKNTRPPELGQHKRSNRGSGSLPQEVGCQFPHSPSCHGRHGSISRGGPLVLRGFRRSTKPH
ncbi:MAG: hypothetical protein WCD80_14220, partial [Desulfobaccales bacterium]